MKTLEKIIVDSLIELKNISHENDYSNKEQKSKLIFPQKRQNKLSRISEQEARFLLVRELEKKENKYPFYYSIETPTDNVYYRLGRTILVHIPQIYKCDHRARSGHPLDQILCVRFRGRFLSRFDEISDNHSYEQCENLFRTS